MGRFQVKRAWLCYWQHFCALFINIIITVSLLTGPYFQSRAMSANVVSVLEDPVVGGLCPRNLRATLETWPDTKRKPKVLIVCPTGSNPSGANIPENHRQEIYDIVCEHDLLIIEDDPYYFINVSFKINMFTVLPFNLIRACGFINKNAKSNKSLTNNCLKSSRFHLIHKKTCINVFPILFSGDQERIKG